MPDSRTRRGLPPVQHAASDADMGKRSRLVATGVPQSPVRLRCPVPLRRFGRHVFVNLEAAIRSDALDSMFTGRVSLPVGLVVHRRLPDPAPRAGSTVRGAALFTRNGGTVPDVSGARTDWILL